MSKGVDYDGLSPAEATRLLKEKVGLLKEKDARIAKLEAESYEGSVQEMLDNFGGIPDMPDIGLPPHQHSGPGAPFSIREDLVTPEDLNFTIRVKHQEAHIKSFLGYNHLDSNSDGAKTLSYHNEATVAAYVDGVVKMCLKTLGYFENTRVFKEMTLFSLRPDVIVVKHPKEGIILVIEVKMPGEVLFNSTRIAEQVAHYLLLQVRLGNPLPFVLLSSYREACLCCLRPGSIHATEQMNPTQSDAPIEAERDTIGPARNVVLEAATKLKARDVDLSLVMEQDQNKTNKPDITPTKLACENPSEIPTSLPDHATTGRRATGKRKQVTPTIHVIAPEVYYSEPFTLANMMQGVSLAITCGLSSLKKRKTDKLDLWPKQGSTLDGLHPCVEKECFKWAQVKDMTIDYMEAPLPNEGFERYFLVRETGHGKNGRVSLAVDNGGRACALKFYLHNIDGETDFAEAKRKKVREENFEKTKILVEEEVRRWHTLQGKYAAHVAALVLNQQNVVRMPVFAPVPLASRENVLGDVKRRLTEFYNAGYVYREVRWQHIGCRRKREGDSPHGLEIAMLDLESLVEKGDQKIAIIGRQIDLLRERAQTAAATGPTGSLLGPAVLAT